MAKYTWNGKGYARHSSAQFRWAQELIEKMGVDGSESLLDIGCGDGKITALLAQTLENGRAVGIDASDNMIGFAKATFSKKDYPNLSFKHMDASKLSFQNEFDLVFSNSALHWIKDHGPVLKGICRALRRNGRVFMSFGGKGNIDTIVPIIDQLVQEPEWAGYFQNLVLTWAFHDAQDYRSWVVDAGLTPIRVELVPKDMVHEDRAALEGWFRTAWHPYMACLPEEKRDEFMGELVRRYLDKYPVNSGGRTHVAMVRLEVEAIKKSKR